MKRRLSLPPWSIFVACVIYADESTDIVIYTTFTWVNFGDLNPDPSLSMFIQCASLYGSCEYSKAPRGVLTGNTKELHVNIRLTLAPVCGNVYLKICELRKLRGFMWLLVKRWCQLFFTSNWELFHLDLSTQMNRFLQTYFRGAISRKAFKVQSSSSVASLPVACCKTTTSRTGSRTFLRTSGAWATQINSASELSRNSDGWHENWFWRFAVRTDSARITHLGSHPSDPAEPGGGARAPPGRPSRRLSTPVTIVWQCCLRFRWSACWGNIIYIYIYIYGNDI